MRVIGGLAFVVPGAIAACGAIYNLTLAIASLFHRDVSSPQTPHSTVLVLVPAHDEAATIARCVRSLRVQSYPRELYDVVVIADNCTDATAEVAREAGATVLVRDEPHARGKGHALRWAMDRVLARRDVDALAVVDADSNPIPTFLETLVEPLEHGAAAVQGESLLEDDGSPSASFRAAAFLLVNRVRPAGRAALGLPSNLAGNGMLFPADLLREHPWDAFSSTEDVEYGISLRRAGIRPVFARGAIVYSAAAPNAAAAEQQQLRWEGGKFHVARTHVPRLLLDALRTRRLSLVDAALELAMPPLGLLAGVAALGFAVSLVLAATDVISSWEALPWLVAVAAIPLYVLIGFRSAGAPRSAYRALAAAPLFVLRKLLRVRRALTFRGDTWVRTERGGDA